MPNFTENIPTPSLSLSDETKERLRKVDTARPYLHRAALFGLPAMASANYMLPQMKRRGLAVGAIGAAGAGLGLLDRKIEQIAEEHEELRPTLKNYAKGTGGAPMSTTKAASAFDRVRRNKDELAAAFPMTAAARTDMQKEAVLMMDPKRTGQALSALQRGVSGFKPAVVGAAVGAGAGALANPEDRVKGALVGGAVGGAAGAGLTAAARHYEQPISRGIYNIKRQARVSGNAPTSATDLFRTAKAPNAKYDAMYAKQKAALPEGHTTPAPLKRPEAPPAAETTTKAGSVLAQKLAGMNTMADAHRAIGGRAPYSLLTLSAETSNDAVINQMLRALFANTDAMRQATEDQVLAAFPLSQPYSYGRHRAIGRTADDIKAEIALAYTPTKR